MDQVTVLAEESKFWISKSCIVGAFETPEWISRRLELEACVGTTRLYAYPPLRGVSTCHTKPRLCYSVITLIVASICGLDRHHLVIIVCTAAIFVLGEIAVSSQPRKAPRPLYIGIDG